MPPDWLPVIGTIAAGPLIGAIVVFLSAIGLIRTETQSIVATFVLAIVWCVLAIALNIFPGWLPVVVAVLQFIATLLGAAGFFSFAAFGRKALSL